MYNTESSCVRHDIYSYAIPVLLFRSLSMLDADANGRNDIWSEFSKSPGKENYHL